MRLIIQENYDKLSEWACNYIICKINEFNPSINNKFVLGLPAGTSVLGTYKKLVEKFNENLIDFQHVVVFCLDEYVGIDRDDPHSQHSYMWNNFFKYVNVQRENIYMLDGNTNDWTNECNQYEHNISLNGGFHLVFFGVGADGHVARNEPGSSLKSLTRPKTLAYDTLVTLASRWNIQLKDVPKVALTVGIQTLMNAKEVIVLFPGVSRSHALEKCLEFGVNHMFPVSIFQMHPKACFLCDEDATLELRVKTVRYFKGLTETHDNLLICHENNSKKPKI